MLAEGQQTLFDSRPHDGGGHAVQVGDAGRLAGRPSDTPEIVGNGLGVAVPHYGCDLHLPGMWSLSDPLFTNRDIEEFYLVKHAEAVSRSSRRSG